MTRVLLYTSTSRSAPGGVQAVVTRLARSLRGMGHAVQTAWSEPDRGRDGHGGERGDEADRSDGGDWVLPLEVNAGRSGLPSVRALVPAARSLFRVAVGLAHWRPHVVNVHFLTGQLVYFLALRRVCRFRLVLSAHGSDLVSPTPQLRRHLPRFLRAADAVVVVSEDLRRRVLEYPGVNAERVHVIPNGIDHEWWSERVPADGCTRAPLVVAAGRLEHVKGIDVLIDAFARVHSRLPGVRLAVAGDGSQRADLERQARDAGLGPAVEFCGHLDADSLRALYRRATVFAMPSRSEGMPLALLEAMASGLPVVATRVGGIPEVATTDDALLVPPGDPVQFADALLRVLRDPGVASMLAAAGRCRSRAFSDTAGDEAYGDLVSRLVSAR